MPDLWDTWSPEVQDYYLENPQALYTYLFPQTDLQTGRGNWFRNQYTPLHTRYTANAPDQPNRGFYDFLINQNLNEDFRRLAPSQRGENPSMFAPRVDYMRRRF